MIDGFGYATGLKDKCPKYGNAPSPVSLGELHDTWVLRFGPFKQGEPWTWNVVSATDLARICRTTKDAGCTDYSGGCPSTFTTQEYAHDRGLAAHEYAHTVLFWTLGLFHTDSQHTRPEIWGSNGYVAYFVK